MTTKELYNAIEAEKIPLDLTLYNDGELFIIPPNKSIFRVKVVKSKLNIILNGDIDFSYMGTIPEFVKFLKKCFKK